MAAVDTDRQQKIDALVAAGLPAEEAEKIVADELGEPVVPDRVVVDEHNNEIRRPEPG